MAYVGDNCDLCWLAISRSSSLGELARACLHLPEQSRVFNSDDGLVGEGLEKFDATLRK
jgi:hypothetical protein